MMKRFLFISISIISFIISTFASDHVPKIKPLKKFIELGWDIPSPSFLRQNWEDMEKTTPFDGVIYYIAGINDSGCMVDSQAAWDTNKWDISWFAKTIDDLKQCKFKKFTDNFIRFNATPGDIDWADDIGWQNLFEKVHMCARICEEVSSKGLALDFESYGKNQFKYDPTGDLSFEKAKTLARKRGHGFINAIASAKPDAVILALWLNSINFKAPNSGNPDSILINETYGLLPAFIDGMLDSLPPSMTLIDGCENGYYMDSYQEFLQAANDIRSWTGPAIQLVSQENQSKYRAQVQVGFGFYLDMYLNNPGSRYYFPPLDNSRLKRLWRNLSAAANASDQYIWIYGEQCRWWKQLPNDSWLTSLSNYVGKGRPWEEAIPGLTRTIMLIKDPESLFKKELHDNKLTNLAINPEFLIPPEKNNLPVGYSAWQDPKLSKGEFLYDKTTGNGSILARKVQNGCLIQKHRVSETDYYYIRVKALPKGNSIPLLLIRWQDSNERWCLENNDKVFTFSGNSNDWQQATGHVQIPSGANFMVVLLVVRNQINENDLCWFDDLEIYKLPIAF